MNLSKEQIKVMLLKIEYEIARQKMSKKSFYEKSGVSSSLYSQWNTGAAKPTLKSIGRVADALGLSVEFLMGTDDEDEDLEDDDALLAETNFLYDSPDALDLIRACMNLSGEQIHLLALIAGEMEPKSKKTAVKKHSGSGLVVSADL